MKNRITAIAVACGAAAAHHMAMAQQPATPLPPCSTQEANFVTMTGDGAAVQAGFRRARKVTQSSGFGRALSGVLTLGIVSIRKQTDYAVLGGDSASRRFTDPLVQFSSLVAERGLAPADGVELISLTQWGVDAPTGRSVPIGESTMSYWGSAQGTIAHMPVEASTVPLVFEAAEPDCSIGDRRATVWRAKPAAPLRPGEYALLIDPDRYYDFAIDERPPAVEAKK